MIHRLELKSWKAFDELTVEFHPGTTFIVARNGVGKTSIMQAAQYALFGERALGFSPSHAVRHSETGEAHVIVDLELPSSARLRITRTAQARPRRGHQARVEAIVADRELSETELDELLNSEFGADVATLQRLTFVPEGAVIREAENPFSPVDHINQIFAADTLSAAADQFAELERQWSRKGDDVRIAQRRAEHQQVTELRQRLEMLEQELAAARDRRQSHLATIEATRGQVELAKRWDNYHAQAALEQQRLGLVLERVRAELGLESGAGDPLEHLRKELARSVDLLEQRSAKRAEVQARIRLLRGGMESLLGAESLCPVCRRPLGEHDRAEASAEYTRELSESEGELEVAQIEIERLEARRRLLTELTREAATPLLEAPADPGPAEGSEVVDLHLTALSDELRRQDEEIGAKQLEVTRLRESLDELQRAERNWNEAVRAYRRADLASVAGTTMRSLADYMFRQRAEPLGKELSTRYEEFFRAGGLALEASGALVFHRDGGLIPFEHWSGGERSFAVVLLRLLTLLTTTRARYMWLDEPLEHVDPRNRRVLASLLGEVTQRDDMRQIVVTTYEERLTRRLASRQRAGSKDVQVLYVDSERDGDL